MVSLDGDFERRDRVGDDVGVAGEETVKSLRSVQRC